jgi:hypothetical protein
MTGQLGGVRCSRWTEVTPVRARLAALIAEAA